MKTKKTDNKLIFLDENLNEIQIELKPTNTYYIFIYELEKDGTWTPYMRGCNCPQSINEIKKFYENEEKTHAIGIFVTDNITKTNKIVAPTYTRTNNK